MKVVAPSGESGGLSTVSQRRTHLRFPTTHEFVGSAIASTGDSGKLHLWRQDLNGHFIEFAEAGGVHYT